MKINNNNKDDNHDDDDDKNDTGHVTSENSKESS
jgi:hypothetical protein